MCFGYLNWKPKDFWRASIWEITAAMDGLMQSKGIKKQKTQSKLTSSDLAEIKKLAEREKRRNERLSRASSKNKG